MSVYRWFTILATSALLAVLVVGGLAVEHASGASPPQQVVSDEASTCSGIVTASLSADTVRICDPVTVTAHSEAACSGCLGGLNVVFVQQTSPC